MEGTVERFVAGLERTQTTAQRAAAAAARDAIARARDAAALAADREAEALAEAAGPGSPEARLAQVRRRAALDRARAAADRERAARDREEAARDRERAELELQQAYVDELTGGYLRTPGRLALQREIDRAFRGDGRLVLAFLDVNDLKGVNDREGHAGGDRVLQAVVDALRSGLRSFDPIVRYGGDEFVCALSGAGEDEARRRFDQIHETVLEAHAAGYSVGLAIARARRHARRADRSRGRRAVPREARLKLRAGARHAGRQPASAEPLRHRHPRLAARVARRGVEHELVAARSRAAR